MVCKASQIFDTLECVLRPLILLCSSYLVHTSILSLQLPTLLSELRVCVCVWLHSLRPKSQPSWHLLGLSEGIWSGACCQSGPCITFKEVSVSPSLYHSSSTAPRLSLLRLPLVFLARLLWYVCPQSLLGHFGRCWKAVSGTLLYGSFVLHCFGIFVAFKDFLKLWCVIKSKTRDWKQFLNIARNGSSHLFSVKLTKSCGERRFCPQYSK